MSAGCPVPNGLAMELPLQFVTERHADGQPKENFITDIEDFKSGLFIYPITKILH
jgi:hypothetical protein